MQVIVVRERGDSKTGSGMSLLRYALSTDPLSRVVLEGMDHLWRCRESVGLAELAGWTSPRDSRWVLPRPWRDDPPADRLPMSCGDDRQAGPAAGPDAPSGRSWVVITDGRFATCLDHQLVARAVAAADADVIAVNAAPDLLAYHDRVRLTPENELAGYRRLFADSAAPMPMPTDWPHHLLVRPAAFEAVVGRDLPADFETLVGACRAKGLKVRAIAVAGSVLDLESEEGLLGVCRAGLSANGHAASGPRTEGRKAADRDRHDLVSDRSRLIGPVRVGKRVTVEPGAVIVGPAVLCDGCTVRRDAVVDSCVVGSDVCVEPAQVLRSRLVVGPGQCRSGQEPFGTARRGGRCVEHVCGRRERAFRVWPRFSYVGCAKRIVDVLAAAMVLVLFAPVIPLIALAVRISSPGAVFFRDRRQGLHGRLFDCIKFRTMRQGADKMQDKLRFVCEVDGPQFKITDDPRITAVGRFLRETYLDEIPQFYNVLCGQMSVVGPRPSPEFENTLCPSWRDARLSVRPGITGLWQVRRTRAAHKDFQEWIHYDTKYVRDLSPGLDLWICWRTFRRMVENFVDQF